jgi:hypothetical protein
LPAEQQGTRLTGAVDFARVRFDQMIMIRGHWRAAQITLFDRLALRYEPLQGR